MFLLDNIQLLNIAGVLSHMTPGHTISEENHMISEIVIILTCLCNIPVLQYCFFTNENFQMKNCAVSLICHQNIDSGYLLEAVLTNTHNLYF